MASASDPPSHFLCVCVWGGDSRTCFPGRSRSQHENLSTNSYPGRRRSWHLGFPPVLPRVPGPCLATWKGVPLLSHSVSPSSHAPDSIVMTQQSRLSHTAEERQISGITLGLPDKRNCHSSKTSSQSGQRDSSSCLHPPPLEHSLGLCYAPSGEIMSQNYKVLMVTGYA